ncbi:Hypothetical_protein [Hexamita inflata]|uniref:Hypothetical_protein n=1 Tax=Hexamita inflata TaxID=28002 RepID=A0AA86NTK1_9EUKA|nr:Hypothetical protein HINF_LOCUS12876 [Hexamita inflata]
MPPGLSTTYILIRKRRIVIVFGSENSLEKAASNSCSMRTFQLPESCVFELELVADSMARGAPCRLARTVMVHTHPRNVSPLWFFGEPTVLAAGHTWRHSERIWPYSSIRNCHRIPKAYGG